MQKAIQRGNAWRIQVRYKNLRDGATRDTAKECEQWAARRLIELQHEYENAATEEKPDFPFKVLFEKYFEEVGRNMASAGYIMQQVKAFDKYFGKLANESIHDITPRKISLWRNNRLKEVSAGTVHRQMSLYSAVFTYAKNELFLIKTNPFAEVTKPSKPKPRNRRITPDEIKTILDGLDYVPGTTPTTPRQYVGWTFLFALETAMRRGELINITCNHIHSDYIHLPKTKNGESRDVPLTREARALLDLVPHTSKVKLIPHTNNSFRLIWERNLNAVGLMGHIRFHDSRHEAITRLVNIRKIPVEILAKITGHKDIKTLIVTYYNPTASDIARMLND